MTTPTPKPPATKSLLFTFVKETKGTCVYADPSATVGNIYVSRAWLFSLPGVTECPPTLAVTLHLAGLP